MSMDLHSVGNLVELANTSSSQSSALLSELANKVSCPAPSFSSGGGDSDQTTKNNSYKSSANLSARMESFIKTLSSANLLKTGFDSSAALGSFLNAATSSNTLFDAAGMSFE